MREETFDEQLSRFDLMCKGDSAFDLSDKDIAALIAVRREMRVMARATLVAKERIAALEAENARLKLPIMSDTDSQLALLCRALQQQLREAQETIERLTAPVSKEEWLLP